MGIVGLIIGIPALLWLVANWGAWIEGTDQGVKTSWGQSFDYTDVTEINKRRWDKKGIAILKYDDNGSSKVFVLDDFKFEREPLGEILRKIESHLTSDQIIDGQRESEPKPSDSSSDSEVDSES